MNVGRKRPATVCHRAVRLEGSIRKAGRRCLRGEAPPLWVEPVDAVTDRVANVENVLAGGRGKVGGSPKLVDGG